MNQYLLLRDNKQSGPYSLQDLIAKGLKAYDLVWLEGKSAAWRYPSEFDELKPYAPVVEEQPFDRFYRKPADQVAAGQASRTERAQAVENYAAQPVEERSNQINTGAKHIYVTMPVNKTQTVSSPAAQKTEPKKEEKTQPAQQQQGAQQAKKNTPVANNNAKSVYLISEEDDEQNSAILKGYNNKKKEDDENNNGYLNDYEARKAAYENKKAAPVKVKEEPAPVAKKAAPVVERKLEEQPVYTNYSKKREFRELFAIPSHFSGSFFQDNKVLVRSLLAAVLVLGGVVIGLIINSGKHQPDSEVLRTLVKEIREQNKDKSAVAPPETGPQTKTAQQQPDETADNDNLNTGQPPANNNGIAAEPSPHHAIIKKETSNQPTKPISVPVSNPAPEETEARPAVNDNKDKINQEILEKARKNIYDLVGLQASQYKVGLLGGISGLDITVSNNSLYALDQVAVEIKYFGPEKKLVKTQTIVFNHVPAGKQRTLEAPSTRRGISIDYSITGINSKALGLAQAGY